MILCGGLARTDNKSHAALTPFSFGVETHIWSHYKQTSRASDLFCHGHELYAIGKFLFSRCFSSRIFFAALYMRSTSIGKQKHSARDERRKSRFHHTTNSVTNSGVSTIRASTKPILETGDVVFFGENHEKLVSSRAFRWASFFPPGPSCVYEPQASRCWCAAYALCIRHSLPSTCFAQPVPFVRRHWLCWWLLRWSRHLHCFSRSFSNFWTRKTFQQIKLKHVDGRIFFGFMMMKQFRFTWVELIHGKECSYTGFSFMIAHRARIMMPIVKRTN